MLISKSKDKAKNKNNNSIIRAKDKDKSSLKDNASNNIKLNKDIKAIINTFKEYIYSLANAFKALV